jgi:hypothetical protein
MCPLTADKSSFAGRESAGDRRRLALGLINTLDELVRRHEPKPEDDGKSAQEYEADGRTGWEQRLEEATPTIRRFRRSHI